MFGWVMAKAIPFSHSAKVFCVRKDAAHFSLSDAKNLRLQPERYAKCFLTVYNVEIIIYNEEYGSKDNEFIDEREYLWIIIKV
jgi:hypothetical protein